MAKKTKIHELLKTALEKTANSHGIIMRDLKVTWDSDKKDGDKKDGVETFTIKGIEVVKMTFCEYADKM